jgi:hypothetical protein
VKTSFNNQSLPQSLRFKVALCTLLFALAGSSSLDASSSYTVTETGHLEWSINGELLLTSSALEMTSLDFQDPAEARIAWVPVEPVIEAVEGGVRYTYDWGSMTLLWQTETGLVNGSLILENSTDLRIGDFKLNLFKINEPEDGSGLTGFESYEESNLDHLTAHSWEVGEQRLTFGLLGQETPVEVDQKSLSSDPDGFDWRVAISGGLHRMDDGGVTFPLFGTARVEPGLTLEIPFLVKGTPVTTPVTVAEAVFKSRLYQETNQPLNWPDRRPIGSIFVTKSGGATESNPKALFWDDNLDASDPEAVRSRAMSFAARSIEALEALDAQGMIVWDVEGSDLPITYVGDPRMTPILNPAMDAVADEFFQVFTDAGFKVGVTLRPTQAYFDESRNEWRHGTGSHGGPGRNPLNESYDDIWPEGVSWWRFFPTVERFDRKIQYAKDRWGCTIFYIDTNVEFRMMDALGPGNSKSILLSATVFRELRERHPDVLIIPEFIRKGQRSQIAYWGCTVEYQELDLGKKGTTDFARTVYPGAFSLVNVSDGDIEANRDELVEAVRGGDILMTRGWFINNRTEVVRGIYEEAATPSPD